MQSSFALKGRNPDVLTCIANLSSDEVFTPPEIANMMLDTLESGWAKDNNGENIWTNERLKFLDPCAKSGAFLREITKRLMNGLELKIPDIHERANHILSNQVYGIGITQLTSLLTRRSVYCSKNANGKHSIANIFKESDGNVKFLETEHKWQSGKCKYCGASSRILDRTDGLESHAYMFIHSDNIKNQIKELFGGDMQFDVIIGNPPYQLSDGGGGGGASATPIYNKFIESAITLEPRYIVMITPSRWFSGGKGLDDFRDSMLKDNRFIKLVDFPQLYDVFPGVKIRGGISYWLWGRKHNGACEVSTVIGNQLIGQPVMRRLDAYDVLVRRNEAVRILDKVTGFRINNKKEQSLGSQVSSRKPFGLTNQRGAETPEKVKNPVLIYGNQNISYLKREMITHNESWIDKWKVLLVKAHGTSGRDDVTILGEPVVAAPGSACTETYLVIGVTVNESEARNLAAYMRTRFVRFLVSLRKITQNITRDSYKFVPALDMSKVWTDNELYSRYGIDVNQIAFIESLIAERPSDEIIDPNEDEDE